MDIRVRILVVCCLVAAAFVVESESACQTLCSSARDCKTADCPYCPSNLNMCTDGSCGSHCVTKADCSASCPLCSMMGRCEAGKCGDACFSHNDCNECPICDPFGKCSDGACDARCLSDDDCGTKCPTCSKVGYCTASSTGCGSSCSTSSTCTSEPCTTCSGGKCVSTAAACGASCSNDDTCAGGSCPYCVSGKCASKSFCGASCSKDTQCGDSCPWCEQGACSDKRKTTCDKSCGSQSDCVAPCPFCSSAICISESGAACGKSCSTADTCFGDCPYCTSNKCSATASTPTSSAQCGAPCLKDADCTGTTCPKCNGLNYCAKNTPNICGAKCSGTDYCDSDCNSCEQGVCLPLYRFGCGQICADNRECSGAACSFCSKVAGVSKGLCGPGKPCGYACTLDNDCNQTGVCNACVGGICVHK